MSQADGRNVIGIVGLGLMGTALAERFLEVGYEVRVWNRTREKADALLAAGARWSDRPLADCTRVVVSLYTTSVVADVLDAMRESWREGTTVIDTTTGDPIATEALERRLRDAGIAYLEAPISGSSVQTRRGESTILVGGDRERYESNADLWKVMASRSLFTGGPGSASRMKLISNLVLGLNRAALAEGLAFAEAIGVDPGAALEALSASMAYSRVMDVKGRKMVERDFAVQARLVQHLKDVRLILEAAGDAGQELPLTQVHQHLMERAVAAGWGELDNSAVVEVHRSPGLRRRPA